LRARRGVTRCRKCGSSSPFFWPSIQPQHSAISTASVYATLGSQAPFFAICNHSPSDVACCFFSHASKAFADLKRVVAVSDFIRGMSLLREFGLAFSVRDRNGMSEHPRCGRPQLSRKRIFAAVATSLTYSLTG